MCTQSLPSSNKISNVAHQQQQNEQVTEQHFTLRFYVLSMIKHSTLQPTNQMRTFFVRIKKD